MDSTPRFLSVSKPKYNRDGDSCDVRVRIKVPFGWTLKQLAQWGHEHFDTYCQHEHDCCGRWYQKLYTYDAHRVRSRTYVTTIHYVRNV